MTASRLPIELVKAIYKNAAPDHDKAAISRWMKVSKPFAALARTDLYKNVEIRTWSIIPNLLASFRLNQSNARLVRAILFSLYLQDGTRSHRDAFEAVLNRCTGLTYLRALFDPYCKDSIRMWTVHYEYFPESLKFIRFMSPDAEDAPKFQVPSRLANHFWRRPDLPSQLSFFRHIETISIVTFASVVVTVNAADVDDMITYFTDTRAFFPRPCALKFIHVRQGLDEIKTPLKKSRGGGTPDHGGDLFKEELLWRKTGNQWLKIEPDGAVAPLYGTVKVCGAHADPFGDRIVLPEYFVPFPDMNSD